MNFWKNPITKFCFKWLQNVAWKLPNSYYKKRWMTNLHEMKHQLSVLDRGLNGGSV